ncbi:MAG: tRNA dihydrouridine synthase DusB [Nitrosopumilus sp.]|nr:tRNA dihydrouridine synthase DusB [Nitrosopumilus sp.]MDH3516760.1 tRNA dihydrouridine synthase DusB [Nitrosopumilus sp.]MDH3565608.1 tRNA dihydrouridine synthase DusB [Nitrosopumilus sp.]MDH5417597.1 tRNA dihydrouridine synthase DusB [Nitrosopumilus sp.]MDH5555667.1 tRNA dihydrouridine synthase DusB [Nitrosopumilus sp.]
MLPNFSSRAFLAPMAGVSDPALRLQCKNMGAGLVVTEFTNIHSIVAKENQLKENMQTIREFIEYSEQERPLSVQLFGSDLIALEKAAKIVEPYFDMIDYNMGCPAPHITKQMAGGALLQEVNLTQQIFRTLVNAVKKPVTLKIRSGVTNASRFLFRDIAEIAEDEGIQMITLHPRTVSQGYSGNADWAMIKELKEISNLPIVGNGDITTPEDAKAMIDETGCDYVMIGRGAMGNPFLFEQINDYLKTNSYSEYSFKDRLDSFFDYLHITSRYKIKFANIKSQAIRFTRGMYCGSKLRSKITTSKNIEELKKIMNDAYNK